MPKRIALKDSIEVDGEAVGLFARSVSFTAEHERVDVSSFNPTGSNEYLAGATEQSVEVEFYGAYGATETHATLYPIHRDRSVVTFAWRPDGSAATSATNPVLGRERAASNLFAVGHPWRSRNLDRHVHCRGRGRARLCDHLMAQQTLAVKGFRDLNRAFARAPKTLKKEWTAGQRRIAEPTRQLAAIKALTEIRRMPRSPQWAEMRVGAPRPWCTSHPRNGAAGQGRCRRSAVRELADLLMDRAMQPALEANAMQIFREFDGFLAAVGRDWEKH